MNLEFNKQTGKKLDAMIRTYFFVKFGNPTYPRFVQLLHIPLKMKYHDADKVFQELKPILDQRFEEMNSKNNTLFSLIEKRFASAGVTISNETYEFVTQYLVHFDFDLDLTWNVVESQLVEIGPERFNQQCMRMHNIVDKFTDEMLGRM